MAISTGTFTDVLDFTSKLISFLQANGWTLHKTQNYVGDNITGDGYVVQSPAGDVFGLRSASDVEHSELEMPVSATFSSTRRSCLFVYGATGLDVGRDWFDQPGASYTADYDTGANPSPAGVLSPIDNGTGSYAFFVYNEAAYLFYWYNEFDHRRILFGSADPIGSVSGSRVPFIDGYHFSYDSTAADHFDNKMSPGPFAQVDTGSTYGATFMIYSPDLGNWCSGNQFADRKQETYTGAWGFGFNYGKFYLGAGSVTPWQEHTGKPQLMPIYLLASKDPATLGIGACCVIGVLPHAYSVGMKNLVPGGVYTYPETGSDNYRVQRVGPLSIDSIHRTSTSFNEDDTGYHMGMAMEV